MNLIDCRKCHGKIRGYDRGDGPFTVTCFVNWCTCMERLTPEQKAREQQRAEHRAEAKKDIETLNRIVAEEATRNMFSFCKWLKRMWNKIKV